MIVWLYNRMIIVNPVEFKFKRFFMLLFRFFIDHSDFNQFFRLLSLNWSVTGQLPASYWSITDSDLDLRELIFRSAQCSSDCITSTASTRNWIRWKFFSWSIQWNLSAQVFRAGSDRTLHHICWEDRDETRRTERQTGSVHTERCSWITWIILRFIRMTLKTATQTCQFAEFKLFFWFFVVTNKLQSESTDAGWPSLSVLEYSSG